MNLEEILKKLNEEELCVGYSQVISELKKRGIIRSKNVTGDHVELHQPANATVPSN